jgi:hypothetical protein
MHLLDNLRALVRRRPEPITGDRHQLGDLLLKELVERGLIDPDRVVDRRERRS